MANAIFVYGPSGWGKSTAEKTLPPEKTVIICSDRKPLPWKGWKEHYKTIFPPQSKIPDLVRSNYFVTANPEQIRAVIQAFRNNPNRKFLVWDTMTHVLIKMFMDRGLEKGWDKFTEMAKEIYDIIQLMIDLPDDKNVVIIGHDDTSYDAKGVKKDKVRLVGKLLEEKVDIPSLFTVVLMPHVEREGETKRYLFRTQSDGTNYVKSPEGMFEYEEPNDYALIFKKMLEYYG